MDSEEESDDDYEDYDNDVSEVADYFGEGYYDDGVGYDDGFGYDDGEDVFESNMDTKFDPSNNNNILGNRNHHNQNNSLGSNSNRSRFDSNADHGFDSAEFQQSILNSILNTKFDNNNNNYNNNNNNGMDIDYEMELDDNEFVEEGNRMSREYYWYEAFSLNGEYRSLRMDGDEEKKGTLDNIAQRKNECGARMITGKTAITKRKKVVQKYKYCKICSSELKSSRLNPRVVWDQYCCGDCAEKGGRMGRQEFNREMNNK
ncbi:hypothetical protein DFA_10418 [Cavenderia fasciculata]|uniref:Uncharacterized protein n=1 Tax=Cavenderia fasciculata TaxID=261658 RepID=F4QA57_CACFS|nr:uncharacterized protein DFA_10418 [Cavenderia fasciculata]EGG15576.1 hypothetical protein DFA_10418 [Cavenderia fasciculata]|eukprot:XP_004354318.1 hypothetical protein DFA_10418 [Cavenderia fasciculata]